ncbi:yecA family protein [Actinobacillus pleuropneumoniae]|nr:yecA family protein [Actinobacillus pleuropneumoniae]
MSAFYRQLSESFDEANTLFSLWTPHNEDGFAVADAIADWTSQFLLGLGLAQPKLSRETDEICEALDDLEEISKLGYNEDDDNNELLEAGEEVVEYLRVLTLFLHSHFALNVKTSEKTSTSLIPTSYIQAVTFWQKFCKFFIKFNRLFLL